MSIFRRFGKNFAMPWYAPALLNLLALWVIYRIARSFQKNNKMHGRKRRRKKIKLFL